MSISSVNGVASTVSRYRFVASGGETSLTGSDANGATLSYLAGKEEVYLNGALLVRGQDYTGNDGATISSLTALVAGDTVEIITFVPFAIPTAISSATVTTKGDLLVGTGASTVTNLPVGADGTTLVANSASAAGMAWQIPGTITLLSTTSLSGSSTTVSTISQSYKNLYIIVNGTSSTGAASGVQWNGDSSNSETNTWPDDNGARVGLTGTGYFYTRANPTNHFLFAQMFNYTNSSSPKNGFGNAQSSGLDAAYWGTSVFSYNSNSAITSITVPLSTGTWSSGTIKIYGVN